MKKLNKTWVLAVALLLLAPTAVLAQATTSMDFPDPVAAAGDLRIRIKLAGSLPDPRTGAIGLAALDSGSMVAQESANAVCAAAVSAGYFCQGTVGGAACNVGSPIPAGGACCTVNPPPFADPGPEYHIFCNVDSNPFSRRFTIDRPVGADNFVIVTAGNDLVQNGLSYRTTAVHTVGLDILPQYCLRVDKGSPPADGNIDIAVTGGPSAGSFSVNSTGLNDEALHNAIASGFKALPAGGIAATLLPNAAGKCRDAELFQGFTVFLNDVRAEQVNKIDVKAAPGQIASAETSLPGGNIPTLSEWGLILLAGILTISALWMLHRRRQIGSPA